MKHILCLILSASFAHAATFNSDGSRADVQAKVDLASDGDTVTIPAGTFTWTSGVTIAGKGIAIQGAGAGRVIARSDTSNTIGTGSKTFTVILDTVAQSGVTISPGQTLKIARTGGEVVNALPTENKPWMIGTVTSFNSGTGALVMNITSTNYSGTHPLWIVSTMATTTVVNAAEGQTAISISEDATHSTEISGIRFEQDPATFASGDIRLGFIDVEYNSGGFPVLIHDNYFDSIKYGQSVRLTANRGVIWNNSFVSTPFSRSWLALQFQCYPEVNSWETPDTMGAADTTGLNNIYIENCDFHAWLNVGDTDSNARVVYRHCLFNQSGTGSHGADGDTYGVRQWEYYDNKWDYKGYSDLQTLPLAWFIIIRGGTGVITDNDMVHTTGTDYGNINALNLGVFALAVQYGSWGAGVFNISSATAANPTIITTSTPHTGQTGQKVYITGSNTTPSLNGSHILTRLSPTTFSVPINVTVAGNAGEANPANYPQTRQTGLGRLTGSGVNGIGQTTTTGPAGNPVYVGDSDPIYVWSNTGSILVALNNGGTQPSNPDLVEDYIIEGRDYFIDGTTKPGYTKYTYPHPLTNQTAVQTPIFSPAGGTYAAAQNVTITSGTSGATIRYTTNGSTPTSSSGTIYASPVAISSTTVLKAIAYNGVLTDSAVNSESYTITGTGSGDAVAATTTVTTTLTLP